MSNATGTILRAFGTIMMVILFWYVVVVGLYFFVTLIFGFEFHLKVSFLLFCLFLSLRMFYPKNVFV